LFPSLFFVKNSIWNAGAELITHVFYKLYFYANKSLREHFSRGGGYIFMSFLFPLLVIFSCVHYTHKVYACRIAHCASFC
jgi:hypothetical protein